MSTRFCLGGLTVLALLAASAGSECRAQRPLAGAGSAPRIRVPDKGPTTSPYLFLLRPDGAGFAFNYFRRVRPEMEFRRADNRIRQSVEQLDRRITEQREAPPAASGLRPTGHGVSFQNLGSYFSSGRGRSIE